MRTHLVTFSHCNADAYQMSILKFPFIFCRGPWRACSLQRERMSRRACSCDNFYPCVFLNVYLANVCEQVSFRTAGDVQYKCRDLNTLRAKKKKQKKVGMTQKCCFDSRWITNAIVRIYSGTPVKTLRLRMKFSCIYRCV